MNTTSSSGVDGLTWGRYDPFMINRNVYPRMADVNTRKWYENPETVLQLLRAMRDDDDDLTADTCIEVLAKPWNWADEYERLCGFFHKGEVPEAIHYNMELFRKGDEDSPDSWYRVTWTDGETCELLVTEVNSRHPEHRRNEGQSFVHDVKDILSGKYACYTLVEDFQLKVDR